jgi:hypothetical protein
VEPRAGCCLPSENNALNKSEINSRQHLDGKRLVRPSGRALFFALCSVVVVAPCQQSPNLVMCCIKVVTNCELASVLSIKCVLLFNKESGWIKLKL